MTADWSASRRVFTAREHDVLPVRDGGEGGSISTEEAESLIRVAEARPGFCSRGYRTIRLGSYAGIVSLGTRALEILPKIDDGSDDARRRQAVLQMLRSAADHPVFTQSPVGQKADPGNLLESFISVFLDEVSMIVRGGLLRRYLEREEDIGVVRGSIDLARQLGSLGNRPDRVACRFDELAEANEWNGLVKRGLQVVGPWIDSPDLGRRWRELMFVFEDVPASRDAPPPDSRLFVDRRASRYRRAIEWVRWILALESPSLRSTGRQASGLLFDLNSLFQSTVGILLRRGARSRPGARVKEQARGNLGRCRDGVGRPAFAIRPDFIVEETDVVTLVADAKWKRLVVDSVGAGQPLVDDVYQIYAYASALKCNRVALVYPWHEGLQELRLATFDLPSRAVGNVSLEIVAIDVLDPKLATRLDGSGWFPVDVEATSAGNRRAS